MQILKTDDYSLFKLIVANREIDEKHVNRLAKSITRKNLLFIRPLIVNEKMQLIDGQHRLAVARLVKATVHYIKVDGLTKSDISVINTAQKNWTRSDFINFYAMDGNVHYKQLAAFLDKYYWLSPTSIIDIACEGNLGALKEGQIKMKDAKQAEVAFQRLRQLEPLFPWMVCLHIHHKTYFKGLNPWEYSDKYLETLCEECHQITHVGKEINIDILHLEEKMTPGEIGLSRLFALEFYKLRQSMSVQQLRKIYSQLESTFHGK